LDLITYAMERTDYAWIDAAQGTDTGIVYDDSHVEIPIGFAFEFFGEPHETLRVSSNGYLTFGLQGWSYANQQLPNTAQPNDLIAPYWDDLNPRRDGSIYYLLEGETPNRRLTVEWNGVAYYSGGS
jgi:hypothetical protein